MKKRSHGRTKRVRDSGTHGAEARIKELGWDGLRDLWQAIRAGSAAGWEPGEALEYLVIRAFEIDPDERATVRYPYEVSVFNEKVEEIDGAIHLTGLSCLVESKDWSKNVAIAPIVKMRSQLLRRPAGTIGLVFSKEGFTTPAIHLAHSRCHKPSCCGRGTISKLLWKRRKYATSCGSSTGFAVRMAFQTTTYAKGTSDEPSLCLR